MFNRADSFDTFACSEGLEREFMEKELMTVCECKLTPEENALIRKGELPPVYCQFQSKSGDIVQSCTSYIPLDYTGERSAYLVHDLVFNQEEANELLGNSDTTVLNPDMFCKDITSFDITAPDSRPDRHYPPLEYTALPAESTEWMVSEFNSVEMKRLIFAVLNAACGKFKSVFFRVKDEDSLKFIDAILQVLPFHIRRGLSFVTRIADPARLPFIKLKAVTADIGVIPAAKGPVFDLIKKQSSGVNNDDVAHNISTIDFIYSLFDNEDLRHSFLAYANKAAVKVPALAALNLKAIGDLIFLFRCGSGYFEEKTVLPNDDKVLEFFTVYEKNKNAMSDEYRINAMKCLQRYPDAHIAIPKPVFAKVAKIYPTEIYGTRHIIMNVALELIHTDIMRDRLFAFLKSNYQKEDDETRTTITIDLCKVFYGGFLQKQILEFFFEHFENETEETRNAIVEKLLLSLRTKAVQQQITEFLRKYYTLLSAYSKNELYNAVLENIPDGDALSGELITLVNDHISEEEPEFRSGFTNSLYGVIETEQKHKNHPLIAMLSVMSGYCTETVEIKVFSDWFSRKIFSEYVAALCTGTINDRLKRITEVWNRIPNMPEQISDAFAKTVTAAWAENPCRADFYSLINIEKTMHEEFAAIGTPTAERFTQQLFANVLGPMIAVMMPDIFRNTQKTDSAELAAAYATEHPLVAESPQYAVIRTYIDIKKAIIDKDTEAALHDCAALPREKALRQNIATYLKADIIDTGRINTRKHVALAMIFINYLKTGTACMNTVYGWLTEKQTADEQNQKTDKKPVKQNEWSDACGALITVLNMGNVISAIRPDAETLNALFEPDGFNDIIAGFIARWGKQGEKLLLQEVNNLKPAGSKFSASCKNAAAAAKPQKKGLFGKIFKK